MQGKRIKKLIIKILKSQNKQFYNEKGEPITVEEFVNEYLLNLNLKEALELKETFKAKKEEQDKKDRLNETNETPEHNN